MFIQGNNRNKQFKDTQNEQLRKLDGPPEIHKLDSNGMQAARYDFKKKDEKKSKYLGLQFHDIGRALHQSCMGGLQLRLEARLGVH